MAPDTTNANDTDYFGDLTRGELEAAAGTNWEFTSMHFREKGGYTILEGLYVHETGTACFIRHNTDRTDLPFSFELRARGGSRTGYEYDWDGDAVSAAKVVMEAFDIGCGNGGA